MINIYSPDRQEYRRAEATFLSPNDKSPDMILVKGMDGDTKTRGVEIPSEIKSALIEDPSTHKPVDPLANWGRQVILGLHPVSGICEKIVFIPDGKNPERVIEVKPAPVSV